MLYFSTCTTIIIALVEAESSRRSWPAPSAASTNTEIDQFELFELFILLEVDNQLSIEQVEPTVSQSTVFAPPPSKTVVLDVIQRRSL